MLKKSFAFVAFLCLLGPLTSSVDAAETIRTVKIDSDPERVQLLLDLSGTTKYTISTLDNPHRLIVDFRESRLTAKLGDLLLAGTPIQRVRSGIRNGNDSRLVFELTGPVKFQSRLIKDNGVQLAINLTPRSGNFAPRSDQGAAQQTASVRDEVKPARDVGTDDVAPARTKATKSADNGAKRDVIIAIDAGHGGDDPGAIGPGQLQEKRIALAIARELAEVIERERGYKAVLTRKGDYFLPLKSRRDAARKAQADLMVSIHADAFDDRSAAGGSVFALSNRGATSTMAAFLAESENKADAIGGVQVEGVDNDLLKVLTDLSVSATMDSSLRVGKYVLNSMSGITRLHSERVEQAAFVVLKSPDTPSILVETGFISNPKEAKRLASADYQQQMARAIFKGIDRHFRADPPPNSYLAWRKRNGGARGVDDALVSADR